MLSPHNTTFRQLCDCLVKEYPDAAAEEIMADVRELLQQLREQGLVQEVDRKKKLRFRQCPITGIRLS
jgi:Fe2+ or Zn2+ uptake regulation protein